MLTSKRTYPAFVKAAIAVIFFLASHPQAFFGCMPEERSAILYVDLADNDEDVFIRDGRDETGRIEYQEESRNDTDAKGSLKLKQQTSPVVIPIRTDFVRRKASTFDNPQSAICVFHFPQKLFHPPQA